MKIIIIAPIIRYILSLSANQLLFSNLKLSPFLELSPSLSIGFLITGLFLLSIVEVLKIGVDLEEKEALDCQPGDIFEYQAGNHND